MSETEKPPQKLLQEEKYPSLNRKDLMSLSTLTEKDVPIRHFKKLHTKRDWSVNLYNLDIEGSSPRRIGAFNQKIDYTNKNDDIEHSSPKILHVGLKKPEYNLRNGDIEFSIPSCVKIKTKRHLNPLEPKYSLPQTETIPYEVPKFIRDGIQISDIEGAKSRQIMSKWAGRDSLNKDDIIGSNPKKPYIRKSLYSSMDYRDVTHCDFKTRRATNPLEPVYKLGYANGEKVTVGEIEKNKPKIFSRYNYEEPFNLKVNDIIGTNSGSKNHINKFNGKNFIYTSMDILGTNSGTLKKGIITNRHLNPLVPIYRYPGEEELKEISKSENNVKQSDNSKSPKIEESENKKAKVMQKEEKWQNEIKSINMIKEQTKKEKKVDLDLDGRPYVEDTVEFDKDKYKRPKPFYGFVHDKYIIPPIEEYKKNPLAQTMRGSQEMNAKLKFSR